MFCRSRHSCRFAGLIATLALALVAAAPAAADPLDLRSPDVQSLAAQSSGVDLRSPDVQDHATPSSTGTPAPGSESTSSTDSVDWGYLVAGGLAVALLAGGVVVMRRRPRATAAH